MTDRGRGERQRAPKGTLKRLLGYVGRQRGLLTTAVVFLVLGTMAMSFQPLVFGRAVDDLSQGDASRVATYGSLILGIALVSGLLIYVANRLLAKLAQRSMEELRNELFDKMQSLSLAFYDQEASGDLNARITSDIEAINQFFSMAIGRIISAGMTVVTMLVIMFLLDPVMAFLVLLIVPLAGGVVAVLDHQRHSRGPQARSS